MYQFNPEFGVTVGELAHYGEDITFPILERVSEAAYFLKISLGIREI